MDNDPDKKDKHVGYQKDADSKQDPEPRFTNKKRKEKEAEEGAVGGF